MWSKIFCFLCKEQTFICWFFLLLIGFNLGDNLAEATNVATKETWLPYFHHRGQEFAGCRCEKRVELNADLSITLQMKRFKKKSEDNPRKRMKMQQDGSAGVWEKSNESLEHTYTELFNCFLIQCALCSKISPLQLLTIQHFCAMPESKCLKTEDQSDCVLWRVTLFISLCMMLVPPVARITNDETDSLHIW